MMNPSQVVLRVRNIGSVMAQPSTAYIHFTNNSTGPSSYLAVPALGPGQWAQLIVPIPANSWSNSAIYFSMYADIVNEIVEMTENNNSSASTCFGPAS